MPTKKTSSQSSDSLLSRQFMKGGLGGILVKAVQMALTLGVAIALARTLGPINYGIYTYALTLLTLLAIPAQLGLPTLIVRETAAAQAKEDWPLLKGLWRWANIQVLVFSAVIISFATLLAFLLRDSFSGAELGTFAWSLALLPLLALGALRGAALRGLKKIVVGQLPEHVARPAVLLCLVLMSQLYWQHADYTAPFAMAAHVISGMLAYMLGAFLLRIYRPEPVKRAAPVYQGREWFLSVGPMALLGAVHVLNLHTDILMVGFYMDAEAVGVYRIAALGGSVVIFTFQALNTALMPFIAQLHAKNQRDALERLMRKGAWLLGLINCGVLATLLFFGPQLIHYVFGSQYVASVEPLWILSLCFSAASFYGFGSSLLVMCRQERWALYSVLCATCGNMLGNLVLIPLAGLVGAALATGLSYFLWRVLACRFAISACGIKTKAF